VTIIKGINVFFDVAGGYRCIKVFELLAHLGAGAYLVVLFGHLYGWNLLLLEGPSCLNVTSGYKISVGFPFGLLQNFKKER
jgi:hypothetical protein